MIEILAYIAFGFLAVRIAVTALNIFSDVILKRGSHRDSPFVSILIPARNEEKALPGLIGDLEKLDYPRFEVIVYDDCSEDGTPEVLEKASENHAWFNYVSGDVLPQGWLGKNYACHYLAGMAKGDYFLFLDADVIVKPGLLRDSVSAMNHARVKLLSVFPQQVLRSAGEWLTVPIMNQILVSILPLVMVKKSPWKDFAAANGQFMLFDAQNYLLHRYHEKFRGDPVEDIRIMREMKRLGYRVETLLSSGQISCRMYHSYGQAINGFTKNVIEFFGGRLPLILLYLLLTNFGLFFVFFGLPSGSFIVFLIMTVVLRGMTSWVSRQKILPNILLMPFQQVSFNLIVLSAIRFRLSKQMVWKGRKISPGS